MSTSLSLSTSQALPADESLIHALEMSHVHLDSEAEKTSATFLHLMKNLQKQFTALSEDNRTLLGQLSTSEGRYQEITHAQQTELTLARQAAEEAQKKVVAARQDLLAATKRADEQVSSVIADKNRAVQVVIESIDAKVDAAQQETRTSRQRVAAFREEVAKNAAAATAEKDAAMAAIHQRVATQVATAKQETQTLRQQAAQLKH